MIGILKKFFCTDLKNELSNNNRPHKLHIATCAILLEMAKIDGEFSESERKNIIDIFKNKFHLDDSEISCLIEASEEELKKSIDLWQFTTQVNINYPREEKLGIVETIWQLVYADGKLNSHEDYLIHKLSKLLNISHKDLMDSKIKVLQSLKP
jgi:uncharacterized tellurite resistance protein B-like protein